MAEPAVMRAKKEHLFPFSSKTVNEGLPDMLYDKADHGVVAHFGFDSYVDDPSGMKDYDKADHGVVAHFGFDSYVDDLSGINDYYKDDHGVVALFGFDSYVDDLSSIHSKGLGDKTDGVLVLRVYRVDEGCCRA